MYHFLFTFEDFKVIDWKEYLDTEMVTDVLLSGVRPQKAKSDEERIAAFNARRKLWPQ
jgi:hypothetical protein